MRKRSLFCSTLTVLMATLLCIPLFTACKKDKAADVNVVTRESKTVGVLWVGKSGMSDRVYAGFETKLKALAPNAKIVLKKELGTIDEGKKVFQELEGSTDGIVFLRSTGARFFKKYTPKKPSFFGGCNNPVVLGALKSMDRPEGMVTGVTYALPYFMQITTFKKIMPNLKKVCLLVEKGHPSAPIDIDGTKKESENQGMKFSRVYSDKLDDILTGVKAQAGKVDAFIIGQQALVFDNPEKIIEAAGNTPVLSYSKKTVKSGILAAIAADDKKLGGMLAESVVSVVFQGRKIADTPVGTDKFPAIYVNTTSAKKYGITIAENILKAAVIVK